MRKIWREIKLPVNVVLFVVGLIFTISSIVWLFFRNNELGHLNSMANFFGYWNYYLIIIGIVFLFIGSWYIYDYIKSKKFLMEEIKTDRKSEFVKKKPELESIVRRLPKKYERILIEKEKKLGLR